MRLAAFVLLVVFSAGAVFADRPLFIGISESFPQGGKSSKGFQFHPEKLLCKDKEEVFLEIFKRIKHLASAPCVY